MGLINRVFGIIEYGTYHLALQNIGSTYENSSLAAIAFGITGGLAFSEFVSRTLFNQSTYSMLSDFRNQKREEQIPLETSQESSPLENNLV